MRKASQLPAPDSRKKRGMPQGNMKAMKKVMAWLCSGVLDMPGGQVGRGWVQAACGQAPLSKGKVKGGVTIPSIAEADPPENGFQAKIVLAEWTVIRSGIDCG